MALHQRFHQSVLDGARGRQPIPLIRFGGGVEQPIAIGQGDPHFNTVCRRDPALRLNVLPRSVVAFGPDEGKDIAFATVFAHESRCESEATPGLNIGSKPKNGCGKQVNFVVDDQTPVAGIKEIEVRICAFALRGHHLVGRDGDRSNLLA